MYPLSMLCVALGGCTAMASPEEVAFETALHSVMVLRVEDGEAQFIGSGTLVKDKKILSGELAVVTAKHVLEDEVHLRFCGVKKHSSDLHCADRDVSTLDYYIIPDTDVAVILVDKEIAEPAKVGHGLTMGQQVVSSAFPAGRLQVTRAQIVGRSDNFYQMLGWCDLGSSGGGVFSGKHTLNGVISSIQVEGNPLLIVRVHELCYVNEIIP